MAVAADPARLRPVRASTDLVQRPHAGPVLLVLVLLETMPRLLAWQQWRANPQLHGAEMEVTVSATGMRVHSPGAVSDCAWEVFRQVHETDRAFLLSFSPKASSPMLVLPKRGVTGQADIAALGALLHRRIGGSKTSTSGRTRVEQRTSQPGL
jgi:YcxB-like protein